MKWLQSLKGKKRLNESLSKHTSFKVGGLCSVWFEPRGVKDLSSCIERVHKRHIPYCVVGNGTNIIFKKGGFSGIVIRLTSPCFRLLDRDKRSVAVGAGVHVRELLRFLSSYNLSGYEFLAGIPATIGGALAMNAGTTIRNKRKSIADIVESVTVMDKRSRIHVLSKDQLLFGYRRSNLSNYIILKAQLHLKHGRPKIAKDRIKKYLKARTLTHDYSKPNAGCIFRNPSPETSAGYLIERSGCKGMCQGGAMISLKHANFILNCNNATADDIIQLIRKVKQRVYAAYRIRLQEEICIV